MKLLSLAFLFSLTACSVCDIPLVEYSTLGGSEHSMVLTLAGDEYKMTREQWPPGEYENRVKIEDSGNWSCVGSKAVFFSKNGKSEAEFKEIGENPLGLLDTSKALVFKASNSAVFSNEILYQDIEND